MSKKIFDYSEGSVYKTVFEFDNAMVYLPSNVGMNLLSVLPFDFLEEYMDYDMHQIAGNLWIFRSEPDYFHGVDKWLNRLDSIIIQPDTVVDFEKGITKVYFGNRVFECPIRLVDRNVQAIYKDSGERNVGTFVMYIFANEIDDRYDDPDCFEYGFTVKKNCDVYRALVNKEHTENYCLVGLSYLGDYWMGKGDVLDRIR